MGILVSNSERHHAFQTALALDEAGQLDQLVTGPYYEPRWMRARLLERSMKAMHATRDLQRFRARQIDGLDTSRVRSIMWPELVERGWAKVPRLHRYLASETLTYWKNERFDHSAARRVKGVDGVHAFEQCAEFQLMKARSIGATRVLDQPIIHRGLVGRLEDQERERLRMPAPPRPRGYDAHLERKERELGLAEYLFTGLEFVRRSYVDAGFPEDRVFLVPFGVDVESGPVARPPREPGPLRILYVGQVSWWKGLSFLLDVFEGLEEDAELTVIGLLHPEWKDFFEDRFASMRRPPKYLQRIPHSDMAKQLADADVLVFPSIVGGIGLVVYEAMAVGLPVITSDGDVVIRDGVDGLVAPYGDTDAWRASLTALKDDPALGARLSAGGLERIKSFTWEKYREGIRAAWGQITESRRT